MDQGSKHSAEQWQDGLAAVAVIAIIVALASFWLAGMS